MTQKILSVSNDYIKIVEGYFFNEIIEYQLSGKEVSSYIIGKLLTEESSNPKSKISFSKKIFKCLKELDEVWNKQGPEYNNEIKKIKGSVLTIEAYPRSYDLLASYAIYFDYIVIRDIPYFNMVLKENDLSWNHLVNSFYHLISILLLKNYLIGECPFIILGSTLYGLDKEDSKKILQNQQWLLNEINNFIYSDRDKKKINIENFRKILASEKDIAIWSLDPVNTILATIESIMLATLNNNEQISSKLVLFYRDKFKSRIEELLIFSDYSQKYDSYFAFTSMHWPYHEFRNYIIEKKYRDKFKVASDFLMSYSFRTEYKWIRNLSIHDTWKIQCEGFLEELKKYFSTTIQKIDKYMLSNSEEKVKSIIKDFQSFINEKSKEIYKNQNIIYQKTKVKNKTFGAIIELSVNSLATPALLPRSLIADLSGVKYGMQTNEIRDIKNEDTGIEYLKKVPTTLLIDLKG